MSTPERYSVQVHVEPGYLPEQSDEARDRFVFRYTVTIRNTGTVGARLLSRHWVIHHGNGRVQEVRGPGVVGEQPHLRPGEAFQYTSGTLIETPTGSMEGSYRFLADDGTEFDAQIPRFVLSVPRTLH
ncbi:MAG TPA: Co2+/Mg2+ efflux protein ApaG [Chromatiales bacterium]|nr:Co2+/Mg2+ efflux protein ApaG [Chromatiales bacterium]